MPKLTPYDLAPRVSPDNAGNLTERVLMIRRIAKVTAGGKNMRFKVIYPDQSSEILLNVPNYNFNWQPTYRLVEPKLLPAGSRVVIDGAFDNSEMNPGAADPTVPALGGLQTWEEMFIGYFTFHNTQEI